MSHLESEEAEAWAWFSEDLEGAEHAERVRLELLKATYRLDRESRPDIYRVADQVATQLGLAAPVTLYQMQEGASARPNAALFYLPGEIHIAFVGTILQGLPPAELAALLGHEMAHFLFLETWDHKLRVLDELLHALVYDEAAQPVHGESYRLFQLYREVFCDRGALLACGDLNAAISLLVRVETGATDVSAEGYLRQTDEIFSKDTAKTQGLSHPECFIRARALKLWSQQEERCEDTVRSMIEGGLSLEGMDLLSQREAAAMTRRLLETLLAERWLCTDSVLAHARMFFDDFEPPDEPPSEAELDAIRTAAEGLTGDYLCYLLLDFAACDHDVEDPALAAALLVSRRLGIDESFRKIAMKELRLKKRQFDTLEETAERIVASARESEVDA